jgi:3-hydroxyisobutyrate dehydrogenase-like beta-hydroxyacid dehydrogenase
LTKVVATDVSVVGTGAMGAAIARTLLASGRSVCVWNRTIERTSPLIDDGALLARTPIEAARRSSVTLAVLSRGEDLKNVLEDADLNGVTVANLSGISPSSALAIGRRLSNQGARYLTGSIMANPRDIGGAKTSILISGPQAAYDDYLEIFQVLAPRSVFVDETWDGAKRLSLSLAAQLHAALGGFFEGANLARAHNMSTAAYAVAVVEVLGPLYKAMLENLAEAIDNEDHSAKESSIATESHVVRLVTDYLTSERLPSLAVGGLGRYLADAEAAGLGASGLAALADFMRKRR